MIGRLAPLALTAALLAGCATAAAVDAGKALAAGWAALDGASLAADTAVHAGKLHGQAAATVSTDIKKAAAALKIADDAYHGANKAADPLVQIAIATAAVAEITSIVTGASQ